MAAVSPSLVPTSVQMEIPRREKASFQKRQGGCQCKEVVFFSGCVFSACTGTFVSECSGNISLSSKGMNALFGWEGGEWEGAQVPAALAFGVTSTVEGSGNARPGPCRVA